MVLVFVQQNIQPDYTLSLTSCPVSVENAVLLHTPPWDVPSVMTNKSVDVFLVWR